MTGQHEDPAGHAGARLGQAFAVLAAAAEAFAQLQATRAAERAAQSERAAADARAQLRARHAADRMVWAPLLDAQRLRESSVPDMLAGWGAARSWPQDPEAQAAQRMAEVRLTELRPEAMRRYREQLDDLGAVPEQAMADVSWLLDRDPARFTGEPAPARPALEDGASATVTDLVDVRRRPGGGLAGLDDGPAYREERTDAPTERAVDKPRTGTAERPDPSTEVAGATEPAVLSARADLYQRCFPGDELVVDAGAVLVAMEADSAVRALSASLAPSLPQAQACQ